MKNWPPLSHLEKGEKSMNKKGLVKVQKHERTRIYVRSTSGEAVVLPF